MLDMNEYRGMRVFVYLRQSNKEESGKQVQSLDDQRKDCMEVVERWGLKVVEIIEEDESAWKPHERAKFKRMLKDLSYKSTAKRRADGIVAWHPNRLSRNALEAGMIIQMLDDELIKNLFFSYAYSFMNTTSGKEHLTIEFARAKGYNDSLSEVVMRWIRSREKKGWMSTYVKFGYKQKREHKNPKLCTMYPIPDGEKFECVKRSFELAKAWNSTRSILKQLQLEFSGLREHLNRAMIDKRLRDSFYCGQWVVCQGKKNERTIDLNKIILLDGTRFEPAISVEDFYTIQRLRSGNANGTGIRRKRENPLPQLVYCHHCGWKMYASYRKIRRAWDVIEEHLGYECQGKPNWKRCTQCRVKAEILFESVTRKLEKLSPKMDEKRYRELRCP